MTFDGVAGFVTALEAHRVFSGALEIGWRQRAVDALLGAPEGPSLDLCAGTLDLTVLLERARPHHRLIACDVAEPGLLEGRVKVPRAETVVADAHALPFADASMAVVVCSFGVRDVADPELAIREVHRVLMPRGVFVTLDLFRPERFAARLFRRGFLSLAEYQRALTQAGFASVKTEELALGVASIVRACRPEPA
jgi:ubiquinone/menaquinone biosynthesis C-methylase UbiE